MIKSKYNDNGSIIFVLENLLYFREIENNICEQFGVWVEKSMYGRKYMGIQRATFLSNKQGVLTNIWEKVKVPGHAEEVLEVVKKIEV